MYVMRREWRRARHRVLSKQRAPSLAPFFFVFTNFRRFPNDLMFSSELIVYSPELGRWSSPPGRIVIKTSRILRRSNVPNERKNGTKKKTR